MINSQYAHNSRDKRALAILTKVKTMALAVDNSAADKDKRIGEVDAFQSGEGVPFAADTHIEYSTKKKTAKVETSYLSHNGRSETGAVETLTLQGKQGGTTRITESYDLDHNGQDDFMQSFEANDFKFAP